MSTTNTTNPNNFKSHDRVLCVVFGVCLAAAAVGVLDLLGSL